MISQTHPVFPVETQFDKEGFGLRLGKGSRAHFSHAGGCDLFAISYASATTGTDLSPLGKQASVRVRGVSEETPLCR